MPHKRHSRKQDDAKSSSVQLNGLQPLCDGPKLHPFPNRKAAIHYLRQLGDPDRDGQGYVFEVKIARKIYALKIVSEL